MPTLTQCLPCLGEGAVCQNCGQPWIICECGELEPVACLECLGTGSERQELGGEGGGA